MTDETTTTEQAPRPTVVIVALPAADDPIAAASSEQPSAHMTLAFLGNVDDLGARANVTIDDLAANVAAWAGKIDGPITEGVAGTALLGPDKAQVVLVDASAFADIQRGMTTEAAEGDGNQALEVGADEFMPIARAWQNTDQYPVWTPHVTLGYTDAPPLAEYAGESIVFDRIALWADDDYREFPLGMQTGEPVETPDQDAIVAAAPPALVEDAPVDEVNDAPVGAEPDDEGDEDSIDDMVEIPFHGVAAPVDAPTGDGRLFRGDGLTFADRVIMRWAPEDWGGHAGAKRVGRVTDLWIEDGLVKYKGFFSAGLDEVDAIIAGLADGSLGGVSVDVDNHVIEGPDVREIVIPDNATDDEMNAALQAAMQPATKTFAEARIRGITIVDIPAFVEAYVALGDCDCPDEVAEHDEIVDEPEIEIGEDDLADFAAELDRMARSDADVLAFTRSFNHEAATAGTTEGLPAIIAAAFAPGTHDGPGWITHPVATSRIRRYWVSGKGAAKIGWGAPGDFNRCRKQLAKYVQNPSHLAGLCANMHKERLGVWPGQENGGRRGGLVASGRAPSRPSVVIVAAGYDDETPLPPRDWFQVPKLDGPTPLTITPEGRVYGHLALWDTCHIGNPGVCTTAPRSSSDYAFFHLGLLETDGGEVPVGHITMNTGHAGLRDPSRVAAAHYDNTGAVAADIVLGEDEWGPCFSGALRPNVSEQQRRELKAASLSGDWRDFGNETLDLVAALAVNTPGFPIPRRALAASAGHQAALVAAGMLTPPSPEERKSRITLARETAEAAVRADRIARIRRKNP